MNVPASFDWFVHRVVTAALECGWTLVDARVNDTAVGSWPSFTEGPPLTFGDGTKDGVVLRPPYAVERGGGDVVAFYFDSSGPTVDVEIAQLEEGEGNAWDAGAFSPAIGSQSQSVVGWLGGTPLATGDEWYVFVTDKALWYGVRPPSTWAQLGGVGYYTCRASEATAGLTYPLFLAEDVLASLPVIHSAPTWVPGSDLSGGTPLLVSATLAGRVPTQWLLPSVLTSGTDLVGVLPNLMVAPTAPARTQGLTTETGSQYFRIETRALGPLSDGKLYLAQVT